MKKSILLTTFFFSISIFSLFSQNEYNTYKGSQGTGFATVIPSRSSTNQSIYFQAYQQSIERGNEAFDKGVFAFSNEDWNKAIVNLKEAGWHYSKTPMKQSEYIYLNTYIGYAFMMQGDKGSSLEFLNDVHFSYKKDRELALMVAHSYIELKEYKTAEGVCKAIIKLDKYHETAYLMLLSIYGKYLPNTKKAAKVKEQMRVNVY